MVYLDDAGFGAGRGKEDDAIVREGEGVDRWAFFAFFVEAPVEVVFARLFGVSRVKEANECVFEADDDIVFAGADGDATRVKCRWHAVFYCWRCWLEKIDNPKLRHKSVKVLLGIVVKT